MNAITTTEQKQSLTIFNVLVADETLHQIAKVVPDGIDGKRLLRIAETYLRLNPKVAECTPKSIMQSLMQLSSWGIELDGRNAYLVPYGKECTLIIGYKGLAVLARRFGGASDVRADLVCENDHFEWENGQVKHKIDWKSDRGEMRAVYATVTFKDGTSHTEVMTKAEVEAVRKKSRAGNSGPWVEHFDEMAKKTSFRRASKWIPLCPEMLEAFERDDEQFAVSQPIKADPIDIAGLIGGSDE